MKWVICIIVDIFGYTKYGYSKFKDFQFISYKDINELFNRIDGNKRTCYSMVEYATDIRGTQVRFLSGSLCTYNSARFRKPSKAIRIGLE